MLCGCLCSRQIHRGLEEEEKCHPPFPSRGCLGLLGGWRCCFSDHGKPQGDFRAAHQKFRHLEHNTPWALCPLAHGDTPVLTRGCTHSCILASPTQTCLSSHPSSSVCYGVTQRSFVLPGSTRTGACTDADKDKSCFSRYLHIRQQLNGSRNYHNRTMHSEVAREAFRLSLARNTGRTCKNVVGFRGGNCTTAQCR